MDAPASRFSGWLGQAETSPTAMFPTGFTHPIRWCCTQPTARAGDLRVRGFKDGSGKSLEQG